MQELLAATFNVDFGRHLVQIEGFLFFGIFAFWIFSLWDDLRDRLRASAVDRVWLSVCLVFGVFVTIACLADWGSPYALMSIAIGLSLGLALSNVTAAICLLCMLMITRPWELRGDNDYFLMLPRLSYGICVGHFFLKFADKKFAAFNWGYISTFVVAFGLWAFVTTLRAADPYAAQIDYFQSLFKAILFFLMVSNTVANSRQFSTLVWTIILSFIGIGLISVYHAIGTPVLAPDVRERLEAYGEFGNSNDIAAIMVWIFPFGLIMLMRKRVPLLFRGLALVSLVIALTAIYLSQSRGAVIGLAAVFGVFSLLKLRSRAFKIAIIVCAVLSVPLYVGNSSRSESDLNLSAESRATILKAGLLMGAKNPLFGVGYGTFPKNLPAYARGPLNEEAHMAAHNSWVLVFAENGLPGIFLFGAAFYFAYKRARSLFKDAPEFLLCLVGYGTAMTFLSHAYLIYPYLLLALLVIASKTLTTPQELRDYV